MADQDELIGTATLKDKAGKTISSKPLYGHPISKEQFADKIVPGVPPGGDDAAYAANYNTD